MKKVLLFSLLLLTSCFNVKYRIETPINGKFHPIILIESEEQTIGNRHFNPINCTAFIISDTTAITAGHCMSVTQHHLDTTVQNAIEEAKEEIQRLRVELVRVKTQCIGNICNKLIKDILIGIYTNQKNIKIAQKAHADIFKVFDINGKDTNIKINSYYKDERRDFGILNGDFKKFNKIKIASQFSVKPDDMLTACGYAGGYIPPACNNFKAVGSYDFYYEGESMFAPGMSGGPVINKYGEVVGIISSVDGSSSLMTPMLGVVQLIIKK